MHVNFLIVKEKENKISSPISVRKNLWSSFVIYVCAKFHNLFPSYTKISAQTSPTSPQNCCIGNGSDFYLGGNQFKN
jgi:hypothetical protein